MQAVGQELSSAAFAVFDHYLTGAAEQPLAVGVSGGGDSVALLLLLKAWGRRPVEVFHVDHGINPLSGHWSDFVAKLCARLDVPFTSLKWEGEKPTTGLSARARKARFSLIFEAMRARNINLLCLGHTDDDVSEAAAMRAEGSNVTAPQMWTPAGLWPQGRGIFCFRPLLLLRRADIRDYLRALNQDWIDDPSNSSGQNLRSRVRLARDFPEVMSQHETVRFDENAWDRLFCDPEGFAKLGYFRIRRAALDGFEKSQVRKIIGAAIVCAGGGDRLPRSSQVETMLTQACSASLCGANIWFDESLIHICRAAHDRRRVSWWANDVIDGRFSFDGVENAQILPLHGHMTQLIPAHKDLVLALPPAVRAALPVLGVNNQEKICLAHKPLREFGYKDVFVTFWARWRLRATLGLMGTELDIAPETEQVIR